MSLNSVAIQGSASIDSTGGVSLIFQPYVAGDVKLFSIAGLALKAALTLTGKVAPFAVPCPELHEQPSIGL